VGCWSRWSSIDGHLIEWLSRLDADEAVKRLVSHGVPSARVTTPAEVVHNPQHRARGAVEAFDHPFVGRHDVLSVPFRFASRTTPWITRAAPTLGQHNTEVLAGLLGVDDTELEQLRRAGVIGERIAS
jgi:crotonobetainyl-CoA:carnitine CoA-transferase CaiB-like acyl-CoA transferase